MSNQKIEMLRGPSTPKAFCGMLVEHADEIEHIACIIQWKSEEQLTEVYFTQMTPGDAVWLDHTFRKRFMQQIEDDE